MGDIRHCFADITRVQEALGYRPEVTFEEGMEDLAGWLEGQITLDRVAEANHSIHVRELTL